MVMGMIPTTIPFWGNGVVVPTCAAAILGMFAVVSYGEPRAQMLNALSNGATQHLEDKDVERFVARLCSLHACEGFQRTTTVYAMSFNTEISPDHVMKRARTLFGVDCKQIPVWNGTDPVEPNEEDEEAEGLLQDPNETETERKEYTYRLHDKHILNAEIDKKTGGGKMTNVISTVFLSEKPSLVVVNTANFTCQWLYPFKRLEMTIETMCFNLVKDVFYTAPSAAIICDTPCPYTIMGKIEAVQIPYREEGLSLVVLLPPIGEFRMTRRRIETTTLLRDIVKKLDSSELKRSVVLPSFEVVIGEPTSMLDIDNIFYQIDNERGGITGLKNVHVANVTHTIQFKVDADDGEPVSSTVPDNGVGLPKLFIAKRPFYYMVWNAESQIPLLFGQLCR